jgi:hypothetical protein
MTDIGERHMRHSNKACSAGRRVTGLLCLLLVAAATLAPSGALAAVSVTKASLSSGSLRVEGKGARASATITVSSPESSATAKADSKGVFKVSASGYRSSTCKATVGDGSTSVTATLSGCTPATSPPPPTNPPPPSNPPPASGAVISPDTPELGPGYVGSDFTTNATMGTAMTLGPNAVGPVAFQITAGALPAGLRLVNPNAADDDPRDMISAAVAGTPTTVQTSTFTIKATDQNGLTATHTYTIRINPAITLAITPEQWAPLTVGNFMNLWIDGSGGVRPYRWAVTAGQLPTGMSLIQDNASGPLVRVGGTPTTAGTFTWTLRLTDAQGTVVSRQLSVTVS